MRRAPALMIAAAGLVLSGCYHAVIDTGRAAAGEPNVTPWAHAFIYGLVPPAATATAQKCPGGVAKVETKQSFLNGLVAGITWGIYTPMTVSFTCARAGAELPTTRTLKVGDAGAQAAMQQAIELSRVLNAPVLVQF